MNNGKNLGILAGIAVLVIGGIVCGVSLTGNIGKKSYEISEEEALKKLDKCLKNIEVTEVEPHKIAVDFTDNSLINSLPDIEQYALAVTGNGDVDIEIFASPEKAGSGTDGWLIEAARAFNSENHMTAGGRTMSVSVRSISSGMGADYIVSGKYLPDAYTPSNSMWGTMAVSNGAQLSVTYSTDKLVGNVAGLLLSDNVSKEIVSSYGEITMDTVLQASTEGKLSVGYTYPYTSSTGLNFLVSALHTFDANDPLGSKAVSDFQKFQANVPFVCYTTQQMRSAMESNALNACIMEYQTYVNDAALQKKYKFYPFGVRHDNPLYEVGNIGAEKEEVLKAFTDYCLSPELQKAAANYGFNKMETYKSPYADFDAVTLLNAQQLWKQEKDSGKPVVAVFVADTSGSMSGDPLNRLKTSLVSAAQYINSQNYIGMVSYSSSVRINLPIAQFDLNQRSCFAGAVQDLSAAGNTATYDAVLQGVKMLQDAKKDIPDAKLMLFVLSDGETNVGYRLNDIKGVVASLDIPIYTIGYNADLSELEDLSAINEAATINADTDDVVYKLGSLFNSQM